MRLRATLTPAEKEDREADRLTRPAPSKKPPRHDLRRDIVRDDDTEADKDPEDRDLSLNYKKVGGEDRVGAAKVPQDKSPKKPGDYWQTESGWGVFPKGAKQPTSAPDEEAAKNMAEGSQKSSAPKPPPKQKKPPPSPEDMAQKLRGKINKVMSAAAGGDSMSKKALDTVMKLQGKEFKQAAQALLGRLDERKASLAEGRGNWAADAADAAEAAMETPEDKESPEDAGRRAAELIFADRVLTNPSNLGGKPLSKEDPGADARQRRAEESFRIFRDLTPKLRESALGNAAAELRTIKEDDPRRQELESIVDGLALACYLEGEDPVARVADRPETKKPGKDEKLSPDTAEKLFPFAEGIGRPQDDYGLDELMRPGKQVEVRLRPPMSESFGKLAKLLDREGDATSLLMGAGEFFGPRGRSAVNRALDRSNDEDIRDFLGDTPFSDVGEALLDDKLGPAQRAVVRDAAKRMVMEDMTTMQGVVTALHDAKDQDRGKPAQDEGGEEGEKDMGAEARKAAAQDEEVGRAIQAAIKCLAGGAGRDECEQQVAHVVLAGLGAFDQAVERIAKEAGKVLDAQDPHIAKMRHAVKTGDLSVLDQIVVRPESLAALSETKDREDTTKMAPQPTPISRTAANGLAHNLDKITNLVVSESDALGVPKKLAAQFAQVADRVADAVDRRAGIQRSAAQRQAADYNPEEIGEEVAGPLVDGTPEPYMKGEWSQQEFRELGDRQMSGDLNKDKPIIDPRKPTPGAQMRPLAKSLRASVDKLSALAEMGQVSPERLAKAEKALRLAAEVLEDEKN